MMLMLYDLSEKERMDLLIFSLIVLGICGILYFIKFKYNDKINNKTIKRLLKKLWG